MTSHPTDPDAALVERISKAMREAVITDDEETFPRLFDLLDYSGENRSHTIVNGLARAAIAAMRDGDGWIACSERLPDYGSFVVLALQPTIAYHHGAPYVVAALGERGTEVRWATKEPGVLRIFSMENVTHWRPLPPPPPDAAMREGDSDREVMRERYKNHERIRAAATLPEVEIPAPAPASVSADAVEVVELRKELEGYANHCMETEQCQVADLMNRALRAIGWGAMAASPDAKPSHSPKTKPT